MIYGALVAAPSAAFFTSTCTDPSNEAAASRLSFSCTMPAKPEASGFAALYTAGLVPCIKFHVRTVPSELALTMTSGSSSITAFTDAVCPVRVETAYPEERSQTFITESLPALARRFLHRGAKLRTQIECAWA